MSSAAILGLISEKEAQRATCVSILGILNSLSSGMSSCSLRLGSASSNIENGFICYGEPADKGKINKIKSDIERFNSTNDEAILSTNNSILALEGKIQELWGQYGAALAREEQERLAALLYYQNQQKEDK